MAWAVAILLVLQCCVEMFDYCRKVFDRNRPSGRTRSLYAQLMLESFAAALGNRLHVLTSLKSSFRILCEEPFPSFQLLAVSRKSLDAFSSYIHRIHR